MADAGSMFEQVLTSSLYVLNFPLIDLGKGPVTVATICAGLAVVVAALILSRGIRRSIRNVNAGRYAMTPSSRYAMERLAHYGVLILGIIIALSTAGVDFGKLAMLASALSVGIGFGLQALVSNFVSGLMLLIERSLKVGDFIELDSGIAGVVTEIRVRATVITTNDNAEIIVPNSEFVNGRMTNWTHSNNFYRHKIPFGVAYGSDTALVRKVVLEAAEKIEFTLSDTREHKPSVWMTGFGDSSLDFALMVWVKPECATRPGSVKSAYFYAIDQALRDAGITIPFPQRDVHMIAPAN